MNSMLVLNPLPYSKKALQPFISEETMDYHYGKHHAGYVKKANQLYAEYQSLLGLGKRVEANNIVPSYWFNYYGNYYHNLFWNSMSPNKSGMLGQFSFRAISASYKNVKAFLEEIVSAGKSVEGSGWVLVTFDNNRLEILTVPNHINIDRKILMVVDVWEHAYYIDYRNEREKWLRNFCNIINWENVEKKIIDCFV
jgi:Fe-Mn family superoxide dismutase